MVINTHVNIDLLPVSVRNPSLGEYKNFIGAVEFNGRIQIIYHCTLYKTLLITELTNDNDNQVESIIIPCPKHFSGSFKFDYFDCSPDTLWIGLPNESTNPVPPDNYKFTFIFVNFTT